MNMERGNKNKKQNNTWLHDFDHIEYMRLQTKIVEPRILFINADIEL